MANYSMDYILTIYDVMISASYDCYTRATTPDDKQHYVQQAKEITAGTIQALTTAGYSEGIPTVEKIYAHFLEMV